MKTLVFCGAIALATASSVSQAAGDDAMRELAADRGCMLCHHEQAAGPNAVVPSAPSWHEIAERYRGKAGAEDQLTRLVLVGTDAQHRHWQSQAAFTNMPANQVEVTPAEARSLVRWILSSR
ncbi:MAG TPA: c-type cytochrome [Usitatibacter sp.]|nr:c-type cytochrome [Usitatibacter sp.]